MYTEKAQNKIRRRIHTKNIDDDDEDVEDERCWGSIRLGRSYDAILALLFVLFD